MRATERRAVAERALETTIAGLETRTDWLPALHLLREAAAAPPVRDRRAESPRQAIPA
jgi:hypothetical protein